MARRKPLVKTSKQRYVKSTVIILGDGETEKDYIRRLKDINMFSNVNLKFEKGNEDNFETKIKEHANNPHVLVIIDIDNVRSGSARYQKIKRLIDKNEFSKKVYFNNYSFETWLLNHKKQFNMAISNKREYDGSMKSIFSVSNWSRNKSERNRRKIVSSINKEDIQRAKENVTHLSKNSFDNPSSNMEDWVKYIANIK